MSFKLGQTLTITVIPNSEATHFVINLGNSDDYLALHMSFRFDAHGDTRTVVCNSYHGGMWFEEHKEAQFPFNQGEKFKTNITFTKEQFLVALPDGLVIHFPNRQRDEKYKCIDFEGEVRIQSIEII
eukprot:XP_014008175.1 PREDICTED: beta-galactoside-binding lectin-like [Salmo salar]